MSAAHALSSTTMNPPPEDSRSRSSGPAVLIAAFASAVASALVALFWSGIARRGLSTPLFDRGDGLFHVFVVDTVLEHGWFVADPRLGMPFGSNLLDFPLVEATHLLIFHAIGLFTRDPFAVLSIFLLLGFAATAFVTTLVMARSGTSPLLAAVFGLLFAVLPYHFLRLQHAFLANYASVPIYAYLILDLLRASPELRTSKLRLLALGLLLLLLSGTGLYYAFFAAFLVVFAGLRGAMRHRDPRRLGYVLYVVLVLATGVVLQALPTLAYAHTHGSNTSVAQRAPAEAEVYGLKPIELFLPSQHHRIEAAAEAARHYADTTPLTNENATASLGMIGVLGLLLGLGAFFFGRESGDDELRAIGFLQTSAILYASVGGLASIVSHVALPGVRSVNRISVFIAFFAFFALARFLERHLARAQPRRRRILTVGAASLLAAVGVFDELPTRGALPRIDPGYRARDRAFVAAVERTLPRGSSVLLLPHIRFPEGGRRNRLDPYTPLRVVLASRTIRCSYGAMAGRASDLWLRSLVREPLEAAVRGAAKSGLRAVIVFPGGYADRGARALRELRALLGAPLRESADMVAFALPARLAEGVHPHVAFAFQSGFIGWERFGASGFGSWTDGDASMLLVQPSSSTEKVHVSMMLGSPAARRVTVHYRGRTIATYGLSGTERLPIVFDLDVTPGQSQLVMTTDRPAARPGNGDTRRIAFGVAGVRIEPR